MSPETTRSRPRAFYPEATEMARSTTRTPGWDQGPERRIDDGRSAARALGWFSIGLGVAQLVAPNRLLDALGLDEDRAGLMRLYGGREVAHGLAILAERTPATGVWSRVGGDVLDLATLGIAAARDPSARRNRLAVAMGLVAGVLVADALVARRLSRESDRNRGRRSG